MPTKAKDTKDTKGNGNAAEVMARRLSAGAIARATAWEAREAKVPAKVNTRKAPPNGCPAKVAEGIRQAAAAHPEGRVTGAAVSRALQAAGAQGTGGNPGLRFRTYLRSQAWYVGKGNRYAMTVEEARRAAAAYVASGGR